jgi:hypothetical protein
MSEDNVILSTGFNGLARGVHDDDLTLFYAAEKLKVICRAEDNVNLNAARVVLEPKPFAGRSIVSRLQGATTYVTKFLALPAAMRSFKQASGDFTRTMTRSGMMILWTGTIPARGECSTKRISKWMCPIIPHFGQPSRLRSRKKIASSGDGRSGLSKRQSEFTSLSAKHSTAANPQVVNQPWHQHDV